MNNIPAVFRSFIIYALCVVLAIWLGFLLATPLTYSQLTIYGLLAFILIFPVLLRWHYPLLLLSWNMAAEVFFLPGRPYLCLVMVAFSLGISVLQRMINKESRFISAPQITLPLLCMVVVIVFTAKMTGLGLHAFGSDIYGGKKYVYLVGGILGYFALSARRIPLKRKNLYIGLYFLGGVTAFLGDLMPIMPHPLYFIYWVFNPNFYALSPGDTTRLSGARTVATAVLSFMLARYGLRGIFLSRKPSRWLTFLLFSFYGLFGGFRGFIVSFVLLFAFLFFLEGLHRTKWLPVALFSGILGAIALIPLSSHLPYTFQRALTFLPYKVSTEARLDAQGSWDWRVQMWQALLPQVPNYLLLGKGYVISTLDYEFVMGRGAAVQQTFAQDQAAALAEDFHSGPLSVTIPLGIWGDLVFLWFLVAGIRALYFNYRYGDPALQTVNAFLFAAFVAQIIFFMLFYGDLSSDMLKFTGLLGLGVALNGGVRRRVHAVKPVPQPQKIGNFTRLPPSPTPAFQRRRQ